LLIILLSSHIDSLFLKERIPKTNTKMKSTRLLPTIPWIIFGVIEPLLILNVTVTILLSPTSYAATQTDPTLKLHYPLLSPGAYGAVLQLANTCAMVVGLNVLLIQVANSRQAVQGYLIVTSVTDIGHLMATAAGMGKDYFWDVPRWDYMAWINVVGSVLFLGLRLATLMDAFGAIGGEERREVEARQGKTN